MLPCALLAAGTISRRAVSVAYHLQLRGTMTTTSALFTHNLPGRHFSSRLNGEDQDDKTRQQPQPQSQQPHLQHRNGRMGDRIQRPSVTARHSSSNVTSEVDAATPSPPKSSKTKWRAPFWRSPSSSSSSPSSPRKRSRRRNTKHTSNSNNNNHPSRRRTINRFRDITMPVREHLDPDHSLGFPTSDWVHVFGSLPMTSLEEVLDAIERDLRREALEGDGIIDLDAHWNPHRDGENPPSVPSFLEHPIRDSDSKNRIEYVLDKKMDRSNGIGDSDGDSLDVDVDVEDDGGRTMRLESFRVVKAHLVLSPFGRPTGWNLKLANPSVVHALLSVAHNARVKGTLRIGWKFARVSEYHPPSSSSSDASAAARSTDNHDYNPSDTQTMLTVNDSMVRFENCPNMLTEDYLRHMLSRYELTRKGSTIIRWQGKTSDGKLPPLTYVVRFASPDYARAAVREMQGKILEGKPLKLIQYPRQLL